MSSDLKAGSDWAIDVENLGKKYRLFQHERDRLKEALHPLRRKYHTDFWALRHVSMQIERGVTVGILGRNGSGKSTLLQVIAGVMAPSEGSVSIQGKIAALLELGSGFSPMLTGRENVEIHGVMRGMSAAEVRERIPLIEQFAEIGDFFDRPLRGYSSGMAMRLGFAAAIYCEPEILVVDEALAVGDAYFQNRCFNRIEEIKKAGATILFVSHSTDAVVRLCDRAMVLSGGELVFDGNASAARDVYENMLFGTRSVVLPPAMQQPGRADTSIGPTDGVPASAPGARPPAIPVAFTPAEEIAVAAFCHTAGDAHAYVQRPGFNPHHMRLGPGNWAQFSDYLIVSAGVVSPVHLRQGEDARVYAKFRLLADHADANIGMGITTVEGQIVYGTNSRMQRIRVGPLKAGTCVTMCFVFKVRLAAGQYMLNLGIGDAIEASADFEDVRRGICVLSVDGASVHTGLINLDAELTLGDVIPAAVSQSAGS